jgi:hypothetical protein
MWGKHQLPSNCVQGHREGVVWEPLGRAEFWSVRDCSNTPTTCPRHAHDKPKTGTIPWCSWGLLEQVSARRDLGVSQTKT